MAVIPDEKVIDIFNALDSYLGDTDPYFPVDFSDDDIRIENPVLWAAKELAVYIKPA